MVKALVEDNLQKDGGVRDESSIRASSAMAYAGMAFILVSRQ